jgi:hypothetical protein
LATDYITISFPINKPPQREQCFLLFHGFIRYE